MSIPSSGTCTSALGWPCWGGRAWGCTGEGQIASQGLSSCHSLLFLSRNPLPPLSFSVQTTDRRLTMLLPPLLCQHVPNLATSQPRSCKALPGRRACQPRAITWACPTSSTAAEPSLPAATPLISSKSGAAADAAPVLPQRSCSPCSTCSFSCFP